MEIGIAASLLILGATILIAGGEVFVRGAVRLARLFNIPPLVIGLTIVAACTSAPELTVSLIGVLRTPESGADIAVGNVVGSNVVNILLILGMAAVITPLSVSAKMVKREIPFMIAVTLLFWIFGGITIGNTEGGAFHLFPRWGGILFLTLLILYNLVMLREVKKGNNQIIADALTKDLPDVPKQSVLRSLVLTSIFLTLGLGMLVFGSNLFIQQARIIARFCGLSDLVISLTILAIGTSLPELVVSIVATCRGNLDIAVGNIVGSNIFNLLGILGICSVLAGGLPLSRAVFVYDIPIMVAVAVIGGYFCVTDRKLARWEGGALLTIYVGYVVFLLMRT